MSRRQILVNGATGALGRATLATLDPDIAVAGTRRPESDFINAIHIPTDGRVDPAKLENIDALINCAGRVDGSEKELSDTNIDHVRNLAVAARSGGVRRFVQVSSFSVYGSPERIAETTPAAPTTLYGRSKLEAEHVLSTIEGISILSLRLPFMFDCNNPGLLGPLITLFRHTPILPISPEPVQRSMLTYPSAATLLTQAAKQSRTGVENAADPLPFSLVLLARLMQHAGLKVPQFIRLPMALVRLATRIHPPSGQRLFSSNTLDRNANWAIAQALPTNLEIEIRRLLENSYGPAA